MSPEVNIQSSFKIDEAQPDDAEAIARLVAKSWMETYVNEQYGVTEDWVKTRMDNRTTKEAISERRQRIADNMRNPNVLTFVAKDCADSIIGMARLIEDENGRRTVAGFYVDKEYHGRGAAHQLMERVVCGLDQGAALYLEVASYNDRAKAFYGKWGFREVPDSEQLHDGVIPEVTMVRMGKSA